MNKTTETRHNPAALLQQSAEQLAQKHRQRLHRMTREAVYGKAASTRPAWFSTWRTWVALPVLSLPGIALLWQLNQQTGAPRTQPRLALEDSVPAWVQDTEVPLAVLHNYDFYQWLEHELDKT